MNLSRLPNAVRSPAVAGISILALGGTVISIGAFFLVSTGQGGEPPFLLCLPDKYREDLESVLVPPPPGYTANITAEQAEAKARESVPYGPAAGVCQVVLAATLAPALQNATDPTDPVPVRWVVIFADPDEVNRGFVCCPGDAPEEEMNIEYEPLLVMVFIDPETGELLEISEEYRKPE